MFPVEHRKGRYVTVVVKSYFLCRYAIAQQDLFGLFAAHLARVAAPPVVEEIGIFQQYAAQFLGTLCLPVIFVVEVGDDAERLCIAPRMYVGVAAYNTDFFGITKVACVDVMLVVAIKVYVAQ